MVSSDSKFQVSLLNFIKLPGKRLPILENFPEVSTTVIKDMSLMTVVDTSGKFSGIGKNTCKYFTSMRRLNNIFQLGLQI